MLPLNRLIRDRLQTFHLEQGVKAKQSVSMWERVAGPTVAAVTHADGITGGILYVLTRSSAWSQELSMLREPLIARINAELETDAVQDIRFQVKPFPIRESQVKHAPAARDLTDVEREALHDLTQRLETTEAAHIAVLAENQMRRLDANRVCSVCGGPVRPNEDICPFCTD